MTFALDRGSMASIMDKKNHHNVDVPDILVVGDLHLKAEQAGEQINRILKSNPGVRQVVFLGDYNDDWNATTEKRVKGIKKLIALFRELEGRGLKVTVLLGNHDITYLPGVDSTSLQFRNASPGHSHDAEPAVAKLMGKINNPRIATVIDVAGNPVLFSHAGVTQSWVNAHLSDLNGDAKEMAKRMNRMLKDQDWEALYECGHARGGLWRNAPGPLWADSTELMDDPVMEFDQVVGHSPVETVSSVIVSKESGEDDRQSMRLTFCDTLSLMPDKTPIGDSSMLLISTNTGEYSRMDHDGESHPVPVLRISHFV